MTTRRTIRWGAAAVRVATILTGVVACLWGGIPVLAQERAPKGPAAAAGETRTWTDITGKFSREAAFLKLEDGQVHIRLKGGKETKIPLKELSKKDRDWVRNEGAAKGGITKPVGSRIVLRSYKALVDDSVFLADALKQQALAGAIPGLFVALTGGKPLDGFDVGKPIVITIHIDEKGQPAGAVVAVPVLGKERFQKTLETVFPAKMTPKGRSYEIAMLGKSVFAKPGAGYFLLSDDADLVRSAAADPPAPVVVADVAVESFTSAVAEEVRRAGLGQFDAMLSMASLPPNLPEEGRRAAEESMKSMRVLVERLTFDTDRSSFEATIDPTTKAIDVAFTIRAKSATPMAEWFAAYGALRPRFVAAGGEAGAGWVGVSVPANALTRMAFESTLGRGIDGMKAMLPKFEGHPDHGKAAAAIADLEQIVRRMMAMDHLEQEIMFSAAESGAPRVVTRIAFAESRALVAAIGQLLSVGDSNGTYAADADGILAMPVAMANAPVEPFGTQPARIGATDEAVVFGLGCADAAPVKAVLGAAPAGSDVAPVSLRVDLAKLWPVLANANPLTAPLAGSVGEQGMLRADVSSLTDGIELRINADPGVLRLLGALGAAAAQAQGAAGAPGFPGAPPGFPGGPGAPPAGLLPQSIQGFPVPPVAPPQAPAP